MASRLENILDIQAWGYTNIEGALKKGLGELKRARCAHKLVMIVTDGNYTIGGDPLRIASLYPNYMLSWWKTTIPNSQSAAKSLLSAKENSSR